ncbi:MAG: CPBP family intramembrane metalloprotease, partial [Eggerthellaceae bacterium]|nr:CPBP family intramembrane metalloprotease [Eggerthellaceae bacterium]
LWAAFGLAFLVIFIQAIAMLFGLLSRNDEAIMTAGEIAGGIASILFIVVLGGKKLATPSLKGLGETWRIVRWLFLADAIVAVIDLVSVFVDGSFELAELWPLRIIMLLLMCAGIGLYEEATFRGLVFHGLLARMGATKKGIFWAIIISSFIFGLMHIDPTSMNMGDPSQVIQAIMKIVQTGLFGFIAAVIVLETGNIWPIALIHALNDFMLMFMTYGLASNPISYDYVTSGEEGLISIGVYLVLCLAYLPSVIAAARVLRNHTAPDRGQFYRARTVPGQITTVAQPQMQMQIGMQMPAQTQVQQQAPTQMPTQPYR